MQNSSVPLKTIPDFSPVTVLNGDLSRGLLIVADHAKADLPAAYGTLGLGRSEFERHIAFDIGIEGVARRLHALLNIPVVMANYSRLLIDPNRGEDDPTLVMRVSDGALIPDNAYIVQDEITRRIELYHRPYHGAIRHEIERFFAAEIVPILLSLHSFTPLWRGVQRPWHTGVLWDQDPRFVTPFLAALRADQSMIVGDNEPYTGKLKGDCMYRHGTRLGLSHALLEIRQDLIANSEGQAEWAERLGGLLTELLDQEHVIAPCRQTCHFGSYAD